jgi:hypothetical protein
MSIAQCARPHRTNRPLAGLLLLPAPLPLPPPLLAAPCPGVGGAGFCAAGGCDIPAVASSTASLAPTAASSAAWASLAATAPPLTQHLTQLTSSAHRWLRTSASPSPGPASAACSCGSFTAAAHAAATRQASGCVRTFPIGHSHSPSARCLTATSSAARLRSGCCAMAAASWPVSHTAWLVCGGAEAGRHPAQT